MSYVMVTLVLATLFGLDAYQAALVIFIAGLFNPPVPLSESRALTFDWAWRAGPVKRRR